MSGRGSVTQPSHRRNEVTTGVRRQASGEDGSSLRSEPRAARKSPTARGSQVVVTATCASVASHGLPPLDARLKSILAGQAGVLLRGGWPLDEVRQASIDLALAWDEKRGHNRLCHLASRVRAKDAELAAKQHDERLRLERQYAAGLRPDLAVRSPSLHDFEQEPDAPSNTCRFCRGPIGVHVRARVDVV